MSKVTVVINEQEVEIDAQHLEKAKKVFGAVEKE